MLRRRHCHRCAHLQSAGRNDLLSAGRGYGGRAHDDRDRDGRVHDQTGGRNEVLLGVWVLATLGQAEELCTVPWRVGERVASGQVQEECTVAVGFLSCTSLYHWSKSSVCNSARTCVSWVADTSATLEDGTSAVWVAGTPIALPSHKSEVWRWTLFSS